jgi:hypothetical protein
MELCELEKQFPGLFIDAQCRTLSEAERYADQTAASVGLGVRTAAWTGSTQKRTLCYENHAQPFRLMVQLCRGDNAGSHPAWTFRSWGERCDVHLTVQSPATVRRRRENFQEDVRAVIRQLRSVHLESPSRVIGWLKKWDAQQGKGLIECVPGAWVHLHDEQLLKSKIGGIHYRDCLSFEVEQTAHSQQARAVRRIIGI